MNDKMISPRLFVLLLLSAVPLGLLAGCTESSDATECADCEVQVPVELPVLEVSPSPIDFGKSSLGEGTPLLVTVTNVGGGVATLDHATITGSPDFRPALGSRDAVEGLDVALAADESVELTLVYAPQGLGEDVGTFSIVYSDEEGDSGKLIQLDTELRGQGAGLCLDPRTRAVTFLHPTLGQVNQETLTVENCGPTAVQLDEIGLAGDSDPAWSLVDAETLVGSTVEPGATFDVVIELTPAQPDPVEGTLVIAASDGVDEATLSIPLRMDTLANRCPHVEAGGYVDVDRFGTPVPVPAAPAAELTAIIGSTVRLVPTTFDDPDGEGPMEYRWSIVEVPAAQGGFPNDHAEEVQLRLMSMGHYVFELVATDSLGGRSCAPARVEVQVVPADGLTVEVIWDTPGDADETDTCQGCGTDLDLHMLSPASKSYWNERRNNGTEGDCYFNNDFPNWGDYARQEDNPVLDREDTDGAGPESIWIAEPARTDGVDSNYTSPYQVGVYFYDSWDFDPPVYATVRIYVDGDPTPVAVWPSADSRGRALSNDDPSLAHQGDFWLAGAIDWTGDGAVLHEIDTVHAGFPQ